MSGRLLARFAALRDAPGAPDAPRRAAGLLDEIARSRRPSRAALETVVLSPLLWARLGFADRARAIVERARGSAGIDDADVETALAVLAVSVAPARATGRLRALARRDPATAALEVVARTLQGDLRTAVALARQHSFFLGRPAAVDGLGYAIWALSLLGEHDEAAAVVERWKKRERRPTPESLHMMRMMEASLAHNRLAWSRERALAEECLGVAEAHGLAMAAAFTETIVACARARAGDLAGAHALVAGWPKAGARSSGSLDGYREVARMEIALLEERWDAAFRAAQRVLAFAKGTDNAIFECRVRFALCLSAPARAYVEALASYRQAVHRTQLPDHVPRLRLLERLAARGGPVPRAVRCAERDRFGRRWIPLARLWTPSVDAVSADMYADHARGLLWVRGIGPASLRDRPALARLLDALLTAPGFVCSFEELCRRVWDLRWDALRHENKLHVAVHRLRAWLDERAPGAGALVEVRGGLVRLAETADVRVVEPPDALARDAAALVPNLRELVLQTLSDGRDHSAAELEGRVAMSRTVVHETLRALRREGAVRRTGRGPAVRYARS